MVIGMQGPIIIGEIYVIAKTGSFSSFVFVLVFLVSTAMIYFQTCTPRIPPPQWERSLVPVAA
jgi:hypothetical protein